MSLSSWERQALDAIKEGLARSDPRLAALLGTFTRLVSSEAMPSQERSQPARVARSRAHSESRATASGPAPPLAAARARGPRSGSSTLNGA